MENDQPTSESTNCSTKCNASSSAKPSIGRYCHIVKRPDFDGYGFNLHSEKIKPGQYIGKVDPDSPAELAGLREGDQIIEVNGVNIGSETHKQVVQRIKAISNEVRLLLIDPNLVTTKTTNTSESDEALTTTPVPDHRDVAIMSTKSHHSDVTDFEDNNNRLATTITSTITNGKTSEISSDMTTNHSMSQHSTNDLTSSSTSSSSPQSPQTKPALNLNLTAAEMRAKLLAKKKFDPKNESVDLKKKFDIIQKL